MSKYETYNRLLDPIKSLDDLRDRVLIKIEQDSDELRLYLGENYYVNFYHEQDCCESVTIEDIVGDLDDLIGVPLLLAEEVSNDTVDQSQDDGYYESVTWTYYRFRTIKGSVDVRWFGTSNGYYSESVDCIVFDNGRTARIA